MKRNILWPIYLALAVVVGIVLGMLLHNNGRTPGFPEGDPREEKIKQIINYIDFEYLDEVNTDSLLDLTIVDLLRQLDPHSSYVPVEDVAALEETMNGAFEGIGIEFKLYHDTLTVVHVLDGGPAQKAGLKSGVRILSANDELLYGPQIGVQEVTQLLKGESGSKVVVQLYDPISGETQARTLRRGKVPIRSVPSVFMLNGNTGYVKISRFAETTGTELRKALSELKASGAKKLVLDLRDNPGGLLRAAKEVCDQFLDNGQLIVFTRDRKGEGMEIYASRRGEFKEGDMVVLINEGSASASEIVAGAIQDNDRGLILGRRSFGKGLVQEEMTLGDGSKLRLTTQRYYTPSGRSIQKPYGDYDWGFLEQKGYRSKVPNQDSASIAPEPYLTTSGRKVFGGGGINPDIEIPYDTSRTAAMVYHLGLLVSFDDKAFQFVDENRSQLRKVKRSTFMKEFEVEDSLLQFFFEERYEYVQQMPPEALTLLKTRVKAYIANSLYSSEAFQEAFVNSDPAIAKALELLQDGFNLGEPAP